MVTLTFDDVFKQVASVASMLGDDLGSALADYAPSIIGAHGDSVTLYVRNQSHREHWSRGLEAIVREHLAAIEDDFGNPCRLHIR